MENKKENLMATLRARRIQNFKSQFKSVILEGLEIFGEDIVDSVYKECKEIFFEYQAESDLPLNTSPLSK